MKRDSIDAISFTLYLFLQRLEVVNDHTNEEVEREERSEDNKDDKIEVDVEVVFKTRL